MKRKSVNNVVLYRTKQYSQDNSTIMK